MTTMNKVNNPVVIRYLSERDYYTVWQAMLRFTENRTAETQDEIWFVEHDPVFTQGQAGKAEHVLNPGDIPVVQVDRGGQVTYHGPGQLVAYLLVNLKRNQLNVKTLVCQIEKAVIACLAELNIEAMCIDNAPGVYVSSGKEKICSLGLRIRRGCSFHGLALNIDMDLEPFSRINPCGYAGQAVTTIKQKYSKADFASIQALLQKHLLNQFNFEAAVTKDQSNSLPIFV